MSEPCPNCTTSKDHPGYRLYNPACLYCGARIIQILGTLDIPQAECRQRRRAMLEVWVKYGHPEAELRALASGPRCTGPVAS